MHKLLIVGVLSLVLSSCSSNFLRDGAIIASGATGAVLCHPAGPEAAFACAGLASTGIAAAIPTEQLSNNPEIAKEQLKQNTIMDFIHWIIGGGILLTVIAWLIPGPQITMPWRRKDNEV